MATRNFNFELVLVETGLDGILKNYYAFIVYRCEAINKANERVPAVTRINYRVFFPPKSLSIVIDRPDKGSGYDRTIDFEAVMASNSIRKRKQEDVRIVVASELVRIRCESGTNYFRYMFQKIDKVYKLSM